MLPRNIVLYLVILGEFGFFFCIPLIPSFVKNSSYSMMAGVLASGVLWQCICTYMAGPYFQRFLPNKILAFAKVLDVIAFACLIIFQDITAWYCFSIMSATSRAITRPVLRLVLSKILSGEKLIYAFSLFAFFSNLGVIFAPAAGQLALANGFIQASFWFLVIMNIISAFVSFLFLPKDRFLEAKKSYGIINQLEIFTNKNMVKISLLQFLIYFLMGVMISYLVLIEKIFPDLFQYKSLFFTTVGVVICIWQVAISKKIPPTSNSARCICYLNIATIFLFFYGTLVSFLIALVFYAFLEAIIIPLVNVMVTQELSKAKHAVGFSMISVIASIGESIGSMIPGILVDHVHVDSRNQFGLMVVLSCILMLIYILTYKKSQVMQPIEA